MRFVCDSCRAQYMISDEKVGPKGVKVRCKKCGYVILVKKADANGHASKAAAPPPAPVPLSNDPDDALATQVLMNPLGGSPSATLNTSDDGGMTNPGINEEKTSQMPAQGGGLLDASEDEIGAVFDQVLNSGAHSIPKGSKGEEKTELDSRHVGGDPDDRMSTRVIDADVVKKLAEETGENGEAKNGNGHSHGAAKDVPKTDWFVAIDDKQTGPLTLDNIKQHWERGEIGPDSLCWRAGFSDWIPVSEVADLAAELAPRPAKPVMVAPMSGGGMPAGGVMSVPVESAFSAGGMMKSVRSEVQVPLAAANPEETGSWRPSAASALASLVRDEMEALAKPPPKVVDAGDVPEVSTGGLLSDLPEASIAQPKHAKGTNGHSNPAAPAAPAPGEMTSTHGPRNPYIANPGATYSSPAVTQYRPPSENKTAVIAIIALAVVAVLGIVAFVLVSVLKPPTGGPTSGQTTPTPPPVAVNTPPQPPPNNGQPTPANNGQPAPNPNAAGAQNPPQPTPNGTTNTNPPPSQPANPNTQAANTNTQPKPAQPKPIAAKTGGDTVQKPVAKADPVEKPPKEEKSSKPVVETKGGDDEFAQAFGGGEKPKKETKTASADTKSEESSGGGKKNVYIPPAPGAGGTVQESLGQADIMEVVKSNIGPIKKCVDEQKTKEPGTSGKLVMKWTILTSGKTAKVEVVSDEFKSTYLAGCVGGLIKGWTFPKHKTAGEPVVFPFKF